MKKYLLALSAIIFAQTIDNNWTVYASASKDSSAEEIVIKNWKIENSEWFKITDQDSQKTYWVTKEELEKHKITVQMTSTKQNDSSYFEQVVEYGNKAIDKAALEKFDKQFEELMDSQDKYMKLLREKTLSIIPKTNINKIRLNNYQALSRYFFIYS